jgi:hypothetical protein
MIVNNERKTKSARGKYPSGRPDAYGDVSHDRSVWKLRHRTKASKEFGKVMDSKPISRSFGSMIPSVDRNTVREIRGKLAKQRSIHRARRLVAAIKGLR